MIKKPRIKSLLLLAALITVSYASSGISVGCDDTKKVKENTIVLQGKVTRHNGEAASDIKVSILRLGKELDSKSTDKDGRFKFDSLPIPNEGTQIFLEFTLSESDNITKSRPIWATGGSKVTYNVSINQDSNDISLTRWLVRQRAIDLNNRDQFSFEGTEATFTINADNEDCIKVKDNSLVKIASSEVTLSGCVNGIVANGSASVIIEADKDIEVTAEEKNGIDTDDNATVKLTKTETSTKNNIFSITSDNGDSINAKGSSAVTIDPGTTGSCKITGEVNSDNEATINRECPDDS